MELGNPIESPGRNTILIQNPILMSLCESIWSSASASIRQSVNTLVTTSVDESIWSSVTDSVRDSISRLEKLI